jgi:galactoside O-acetyltransferase
MPYMKIEDIAKLGLGSVGYNVKLSTHASFYNCAKISLGNNVRIDDFCVLSAGAEGIVIGNNVHIAIYSSLVGRGKIQLHDFTNISSRVSIYSSNDDYSGSAMTGPTVPEEFTSVMHASVTLKKHVIVGSGTVIMPGVILEEGAAIGALSFVRENCKAFSIYAGVPARKIKNRKQDLLELENSYLL